MRAWAIGWLEQMKPLAPFQCLFDIGGALVLEAIAQRDGDTRPVADARRELARSLRTLRSHRRRKPL